MTEPTLPPGMKAGPEIVRVITVVSETGDFAAISALGSAPMQVVISALKLVLEQLEKLPPDAKGDIVVRAPKPNDVTGLKPYLN
jgi:hypothetical protein